MSASPSFNRDAIEAHVALLHQLAAGIDGVIPLFSVEEGEAPIIHRFGVGQIADVVNTIMGSENHPGLNIYMPWAVMRRDLEPGKKGGEADVVAVLAAVADIDNDKYSIGELPIDAPYVLETSAGNYQAVYPFSRPLPVSEAKPLLVALSDAVGGDQGTKDCSHVWRIPGTFNWPTESKLARGRSPDPQSIPSKKQFEGVLVKPEDLAAKLPKKTNGHASPDYEPGEAISDWQEDLLRSQLAAIPADDYHDWIKVGMALHDVGRRDLWDDWAATSDKFNATAQANKWASFQVAREGGVTTGSILKLAFEHGWIAPQLFEGELFTENLKRNAARDALKYGEPDADDDTLPPSLITARPFVWRDPRTIPPRQWLYGKHYIRKFASGTFAPPGIGKSSLDLVELVAMATGRSLVGTDPGRRRRVWVWNLEDPKEEIDRRIGAILLHYQIDPSEIEGQMFVNSGRTDPLVIAKKHKDSTTICSPVVNALISEIVACGVDVLSIDPFVSCHSVPENDNTGMDAVAKAWAHVADGANCSIDLVHHVRKAPGGHEFDVNDARGASSLLGAVRAARVLNIMSQEEAEKAGIPQIARRGYFRISAELGKASMSRPAENADWYKFESVPLGNDTDEDPGDDVGVVTSWKWPNPFDGVTTSDLLRVQTRIAAGEWRKSPQAKSWAGHAVAEVLDLDLADKSARSKVTALLKIWIANGVLKVVERPDEWRAPKEFIEVGEWATTVRL